MTLKKMTCLMTVLALLLCAGAALAQEEDLQFDVTGYITDLSSLNLAPYRGSALALAFVSANNSESLSQLTMWNMIANDFDTASCRVFVIVACTGDGDSALERITQQYGLENAVLYADEGSTLCRTLGVNSFPNVLLLDRFGSPSSGYNGMVSYDTICTHLKELGGRQVSNSYVNP